MGEFINKIVGVDAYKEFQKKFVFKREILFEKYIPTQRDNRWIEVRNIPYVHRAQIQQEPKRVNRFCLEFPNELNIESYLVQTATKPKLVKYKWQPIEITFIDVIGPSITRSVADVVDMCLEKRQNNEEELFWFCFKLLDPVGVEVEKWIITVEDLLAVDFGNLDYSDDSISIVKMIIQPKTCTLVK